MSEIGVVTSPEKQPSSPNVDQSKQVAELTQKLKALAVKYTK